MDLLDGLRRNADHHAEHERDLGLLCGDDKFVDRIHGEVQRFTFPGLLDCHVTHGPRQQLVIAPLAHKEVDNRVPLGSCLAGPDCSSQPSLQPVRRVRCFRRKLR